MKTGNPTKTKTFNSIAPKQLLSSKDVAALFGVSLRTIYRWITYHHLHVDEFIGKEYFYRKETLKYWYENHHPKHGKPWNQ